MLYDLEKLKRIKEEMVKRRKTVAVAESVTGGHIQAAFSAALEASRFYQGGLTAYNVGQKCRQLHIEPISALEDDSVSEQVATAMALGINRVFLSDFGIGITGYATVRPEIDVHSLFAWFAISSDGEIAVLKKITTTKTDSVEVQLDYTRQVIDELLTLLI